MIAPCFCWRLCDVTAGTTSELFFGQIKKIVLGFERCQLAGHADKDEFAKVTFVVANVINQITFLYKHFFMRPAA